MLDYKSCNEARLRRDSADDGALDGSSVDRFALRLGVGARQRTRLFKRHVGASPVQPANTLRIQRARRLLDSIGLSMTDIAHRAGFGSVRRFNAAVRDLYGRSPTEHQKLARRKGVCVGR